MPQINIIIKRMGTYENKKYPENAFDFFQSDFLSMLSETQHFKTVIFLP
jgi:hypothetical protein